MINGIAAVVMAYGMQGYYCTNNGAKLGEMRVYDKGVEIMRTLTPPDGVAVSEFPVPMKTETPDFKIDNGTKCFLLVPLN